MLHPFVQLSKLCNARALHMVSKALWVVSFPRCTAGCNIVMSCCIRLHTTANMTALTTNIDGPFAPLRLTSCKSGQGALCWHFEVHKFGFCADWLRTSALIDQFNKLLQKLNRKLSEYVIENKTRIPFQYSKEL